MLEKAGGKTEIAQNMLSSTKLPRQLHERSNYHIAGGDACGTDTAAGVPPESSEGAGCVQEFVDSQGSAFRSTYRSSLRSSSCFELRHPSLEAMRFEKSGKQRLFDWWVESPKAHIAMNSVTN